MTTIVRRFYVFFHYTDREYAISGLCDLMTLKICLKFRSAFDFE